MIFSCGIMSEPQELIDSHIKFFPRHITFLKTIDGNNLSNANRTVIDKQMNYLKNQKLERSLVIFAFGLLLLALSTFITIFSFSALILAIGVIYIAYSVGLALVGLIKK